MGNDVWTCQSLASLSAAFPSKAVTLSKWCETSNGHVWADPKNVCSKARLSALVSELQKRGFDCEIRGAGALDSEQYWSRASARQLELSVSLGRAAGGCLGPAAEVVRVHLVGVDTTSGRLPVCDSHCCARAACKCW